PFWLKTACVPHSARADGPFPAPAMEVLEFRSVRAVEAVTVVLCAAATLGRPILRLCREERALPFVRDCSGRLFEFSKAVKTFVLCGCDAQDPVYVHKQSMRIDISRHFVRVISVVMVCFLSLQALVGDNSELILPLRLYACLFCIVCAILRLFPGLVTLVTVHLWYSVVLFAAALKVSPLFQFAEAVPDLRLFIMFDCIGLAVMNLYMPMNFLWASVLYLSATLTLLVGPSNGNPCFDFVQTLEMIGFDWIFVSVYLVSVHIVFSKAAAFHLESTHSKNELRAARAILAGICDAVVELGPDLKLAHCSESLAALLMINPLRNKTGASMLAILATEADREKFFQEVTSSTSSDKICKAFHVNMRDTRGILVHVEMFCVRFDSGEGRESYLLGLREFWDAASAGGAQQQELPRSVLTSGVQSSLHLSAEERSGLGTSEVESSQLSTVPELAVWFDALSPKLTLLGCTSAFEMFIGGSFAHMCAVEDTLLGCTQPDQQEDFEYWIRHCLDEFTASACRGEAIPLSVEMVRFRFSEHHHRFRLVIQSRVTLVPAPTAGEPWPTGLGQPQRVAKLVFERPEWIQGEGWSRLRRARAPVPAVAQGPVGDTFTPRLGGDGTRGLGSGGPDYRIAL
ncbi:unnamed protein product, partial [Prorocentrum cordatum]